LPQLSVEARRDLQGPARTDGERSRPSDPEPAVGHPAEVAEVGDDPAPDLDGDVVAVLVHVKVQGKGLR
jgi:hypothetical protein